MKQMLGRIARFFYRALANMRQEGLAAFLTLVVVMISFLILGAYITFGLNVSNFIRHFAGHVQVVFYLDSDVTGSQISDLTRALGTEKDVVEVTYIPRDQAIARLKRDLAEAMDFLVGLEDIQAPASLEVELGVDFHTRPDLRSMIERYSQAPGVESVDAGDEFSDAFARLIAGLWASGIVIAIFLMFSAVFIVANTVRLTIVRHKDEIDNMRLVGATNAFVKTPFLIEGIIVGSLGAAAALSLLYLIYKFIVFPFVANAPAMSLLSGFTPEFPSLLISFAQVFFGALIGFFGAQISVGRYLKTE